MIYQLIRRDPAWRMMPWMALLSAAAWAYAPNLFGIWIAIGALFGAMPQRHATRFEAGLPIEARDLLLARALSLMAVVWIPALSGAAAIAVVKGSSATVAQPLALAALATLIAAVAQAAWLKELAGPRWIVYLSFLGLPSAGLLMAGHALALGLFICALAGVGLFTWAWVKAPRSFQLAEEAVKAGEPEEQASRPAPLTAPPWAPVLRSVCSWQYVIVVPWMAVLTLGGNWLWLPFWLVSAWQAPRTKTRWLWALPVGRRALLWTIIGPIFVVSVLGYLASFWVRQPARPVSEPRVVVVTLAAILGYLMLTILLCVLFDWRGFARIPRRILHIVFLSIFVIWYVGSLSALLFGPYNARWVRDALANLGRTAPMGLPALTAAAAAVLIALYWAVEKVFSEPDFADKPKAIQSDWF